MKSMICYAGARRLVAMMALAIAVAATSSLGISTAAAPQDNGPLTGFHRGSDLAPNDSGAATFAGPAILYPPLVEFHRYFTDEAHAVRDAVPDISSLSPRER